MNIVPAIKLVSGLAVSIGVGSIVKSTAQLVIPKVTSKPIVNAASKVSIIMGTSVLSWMVADQAVKYTEDKIDEVVEAATGLKETMDIAKNIVKSGKQMEEDIRKTSDDAQ